jgi:hypothetical protein
LTQTDKNKSSVFNNNINVREAIVRPKGDKNLIQQHLRVQQHSTRSRRTTRTLIKDNSDNFTPEGEDNLDNF